MALTDWTENRVLDLLFGKNETLSASGSDLDMNTLTVKLYTSATDDAGGGNEVSSSGTGYAGVDIANNSGDNKWTAAVGGTVKNAEAIVFGGSGATGSGFGTVTHVAIFAGSNMICHGQLASPKTVATGDTFRFEIGDLRITLS